VLIGVIGGSGLYHLDNLTFVYVSEHTPEIGLLIYLLTPTLHRKHVNPETVSFSVRYATIRSDVRM
jgi:hypothetical protein